MGIDVDFDQMDKTVGVCIYEASLMVKVERDVYLDIVCYAIT